MIELKRQAFESLKRQGKAGNVKGSYWIISDSGLIPVKIIGQTVYKGLKPNSFKPVKIEGL